MYALYQNLYVYGALNGCPWLFCKYDYLQYFSAPFSGVQKKSTTRDYQFKAAVNDQFNINEAIQRAGELDWDWERLKLSSVADGIYRKYTYIDSLHQFFFQIEIF